MRRDTGDIDPGAYKVLISAMVTSFMTTFMSSSLNLSVPALESDFGVNAVTVSWVVSAYTISVAALSLPFGKIADITSRRKIFLTGITGFGLLSVICIFSGSIQVLILMRALMGACAGMIFSTNNAILISAYPGNMRGRVIGYSTAATYIGLTTGPVIGGVLNSTLGWRSIFAVSAVVSLVALTAGVKSPKTSSDNDGHSHKGFDKSGAVLYIAAISASLYGMTDLGQSVVSAAVFFLGMLLLVLFYRHESGQSDPIMKVSMFRTSRTFTFSNLAALLNYGATFAISYTLSIYLQIVKGIPSDRAGLILITMPAVQAVFSPMMGRLSDRIKPSIPASIGMGICAVSLVLFSRLGEETSMAYVLACLGMTGLGFAFFSSPNTNAILSCVKREDYGVANSIVATMRTYGQSSGMAILSIITVSVLGSSALEDAPLQEIITMMHISFLVFSAICLLGLAFSLARDRRS